MKIAICDDDKAYRTQITFLLEKYASAHKELQFSVTSFSCAKELLETTDKQGGFDIYILDILMPDVNGISLGVHLRQNGYSGSIIYLSSSPEYALDSYSTRASHYLLKPASPADFFSALEEAVTEASSHIKKSIIIKTKENSLRVSLNSIMYAELCKRSISYHLLNGDIIESISIRVPFSEAISELLAESPFIQCNQSIVVNLQHISSIGTEELIFKDTWKLYLSKKSCREIRTLWLDFWSSSNHNLL